MVWGTNTLIPTAMGNDVRNSRLDNHNTVTMLNLYKNCITKLKLIGMNIKSL